MTDTTETPTYHIGVERRSNPLVVQIIPVYWAEEYMVLYLKLHGKQSGGESQSSANPPFPAS